MSSIFKPAILLTRIALTVILATSVLIAQETKGVTPAPVPVQIQNAKKVFIANAPGDIIAPSLGGNDRPYNEFYAAIKNWGQYELVSSPAEADLVFEINVTTSPAEPRLKLVILDPKTHTPLWWFAELIVQKRQMFHAEKVTDAFDDTILKLIDDVKRLAMPAAVGAKG